MDSEEVVNLQCLSTWTQYNYLLVDSLNQYDTPQFSSSSAVLLAQSFQFRQTYVCVFVYFRGFGSLLIPVEPGVTIHIKYQRREHEFQASQQAISKPTKIIVAIHPHIILCRITSKTEWLCLKNICCNGSILCCVC